MNKACAVSAAKKSLRAYADPGHASSLSRALCIRHETASDLLSALLLTAIEERNVDLRPATVRTGRTTVIAVRQCDVPLNVPGIIENAYSAGLVIIGPCDCERYRLGFRPKHKWLFFGIELYAPIG
jgi:hypothetical protein